MTVVRLIPKRDIKLFLQMAAGYIFLKAKLPFFPYRLVQRICLKKSKY